MTNNLSSLSPGTLFRIKNDPHNEVYKLIGYTTTGEHVIYVPCALNTTIEACNGHYDITTVTDIECVVKPPFVGQ